MSKLLEYTRKIARQKNGVQRRIREANILGVVTEQAPVLRFYRHCATVSECPLTGKDIVVYTVHEGVIKFGIEVRFNGKTSKHINITDEFGRLIDYKINLHFRLSRNGLCYVGNNFDELIYDCLKDVL